MTYVFDFVVVGGGPAGEAAAQTAAELGAEVGLIERAPDPGGAAVHTGTLPSKTLRETALVLSAFRQRDLYPGMSIPAAHHAALDQLRRRKDNVRSSEVSRIRWELSHRDVTILPGEARFDSPTSLTVRMASGFNVEVKAKKILIATGSYPFRPDNIPFEDPDIDDSDSVLLLDAMPTTLTVLGAGVIGCEYAAMFAALGTQVDLVEGRDFMLPFLDREISERLRVALRHLGVNLRLGRKYVSVQREGDDIVTQLDDGSVLRTHRLLYAAGRQGRTQDLGLDALAVKRDKRGYLLVDENFRTNIESIYGAGDVVGFPSLASTSIEQGREAAAHALTGQRMGVPATLLPYGIYTVPEVSTVGETEESCRDKGIEYCVGRAFFRDNPRGKIIGDSEGMVKLIFRRDASMQLLGVHLIGERASELVHIGLMALKCNQSVRVFEEVVFNYPTLSECYRRAARDGLARMAATNAAS